MEKVRNHTLVGTRFVVQEKVHGSNCSFLCDGQDIQFAKRTAVVGEGEDFYQWQELAERYRERIYKVYSIVQRLHPTIISVIVYGEMFGGAYPHKEVKRIGAMSAIQKGVYYCPGHDFYGFDIYVYTPEEAFYLDIDTTNQVFQKADIFYAETLSEGTLDECLFHLPAPGQRQKPHRRSLLSSRPRPRQRPPCQRRPGGLPQRARGGL